MIIGRFGMVHHDTELERLIHEAFLHELTPREQWLQRVSFAYGNCAMSNPAVTREMVEAEAIKVYGPCPEIEAGKDN